MNLRYDFKEKVDTTQLLKSATRYFYLKNNLEYTFYLKSYKICCSVQKTSLNSKDDFVLGVQIFELRENKSKENVDIFVTVLPYRDSKLNDLSIIKELWGNNIYPTGTKAFVTLDALIDKVSLLLKTMSKIDDLGAFL